MSSERQLAANRANAKRSSGPKSRAGKARASQNARRHGLAAQLQLNSDRLARIDQLAREIIDGWPGQIDLAQARGIAHAELDLTTARGVANALLTKLCSEPGSDPAPLSRRGRAGLRGFDDLARVERYVRRSQARRDRLIRLCLEGAGDDRDAKCAERSQFY